MGLQRSELDAASFKDLVRVHGREMNYGGVQAKSGVCGNTLLS